METCLGAVDSLLDMLGDLSDNDNSHTQESASELQLQVAKKEKSKILKRSSESEDN